MPCFNNEKHIQEAILSVQSQSVSNWELIIIDDLSTDSSLEIAKSIAKLDNRIKIIENSTNIGSGKSRNKGIELAGGRWISFLDADDIWVPEKLKKQLQFAEETDAVFTHTSYGYLSEDGVISLKTYEVSSKPVTYQDLLRKTEISCLTAMYNQELIGKYFMSSHRRKQDYALWLSILRSGYVSVPQNEVLAYYRQTLGSATRKKWKLILPHISFLMETQEMNILRSTYYTFHWALNGVKKYLV
jgi:teichuronic acid biosynthesis glycosyltransferase TuaG